MKRSILNICFSIITLISFNVMLQIENTARLPEYIDSDYHMRSLPYIYIILISILIVIVLNLFYICKDRKK